MGRKAGRRSTINHGTEAGGDGAGRLKALEAWDNDISSTGVRQGANAGVNAGGPGTVICYYMRN